MDKECRPLPPPDLTLPRPNIARMAFHDYEIRVAGTWNWLRQWPVLSRLGFSLTPQTMLLSSAQSLPRVHSVGERPVSATVPSLPQPR